MVKSNDTIEVGMHIFEKGKGVTSVITTNSGDRSLIGTYFNAVKKARNSGNDSELNRFRDKKLIDADGKSHKFETDLDAIYEILEQIEEPEFFEIYEN